MGYLVSMHLIKQRPHPDAVRAALPPSIGFQLYRHGGSDLFAIDTFSSARPPQHPFCSGTPAADLSLELGPHLRSLASVYEDLRGSGGANCIKRSYVNLAEALSKSLGQPVLTICADDDELDFACLASGGLALRVTALCDETIVRYADGMTDVESADEDRLLHQYAAEAFEEFTGVSAEEVGLGSWDPPADFGFMRADT